MLRKDLVIVGNRGGSNVGESFERAARSLGLECEYLDAKGAMAGSRVLQATCWHLLGRRPRFLSRFSAHVLEMCEQWRPRVLLTTGIAPVGAAALAAIGNIGTRRCNFLTDDPWSESSRSSWFLGALARYDLIFNPRQLLRADLAKHTKAAVVELRFGVDRYLFQPAKHRAEEGDKLGCDVFFAGGADKDRVPYMAALAGSGLQLGLYGGYWERFAATRNITRGPVATAELPRAIAAAKVGLCLVRRANRDQHCMRTFELPAVGCCMLTEDTDDHRSLFGPEGEAVLYFSTISEMVSKAHWLIGNDAERSRLALAAHRLIESGSHTYRDRLKTILKEALPGDLGKAHGIDPNRSTNVGVES